MYRQASKPTLSSDFLGICRLISLQARCIGGIGGTDGVIAQRIEFGNRSAGHRSETGAYAGSHSDALLPYGSRVGPWVPAAFMARFPPSIAMTEPVTKLAASEARKTAMPLISSGRPMRPMGMP